VADSNPTPDSNEPVVDTEIVQPQSRRRGIIVAVIVVAALAFADYKWRQWMAARRRERR